VFVFNRRASTTSELAHLRDSEKKDRLSPSVDSMFEFLREEISVEEVT
jgi:hypothetical protein